MLQFRSTLHTWKVCPRLESQDKLSIYLQKMKCIFIDRKILERPGVLGMSWDHQVHWLVVANKSELHKQSSCPFHSVHTLRNQSNNQWKLKLSSRIIFAINIVPETIAQGEASLSDTQSQRTLHQNLTQHQKPPQLIDSAFGFAAYNALNEDEPQWRLEAGCQRAIQPERATTIPELGRRTLARVAGVKLGDPPLKQGPIVTIVLCLCLFAPHPQ